MNESYREIRLISIEREIKSTEDNLESNKWYGYRSVEEGVPYW